MLSRTYLIVLPVRILTHWGIGLFCFNFLANFLLILNVLWADCKVITNMNKCFTFSYKIIHKILYDSYYTTRYLNYKNSSPFFLTAGCTARMLILSVARI